MYWMKEYLRRSLVCGLLFFLLIVRFIWVWLFFCWVWWFGLVWLCCFFLLYRSLFWNELILSGCGFWLGLVWVWWFFCLFVGFGFFGFYILVCFGLKRFCVWSWLCGLFRYFWVMWLMWVLVYLRRLFLMMFVFCMFLL